MKKALKIVLIAFLCLFLLVIVGGYIALTQIDFNAYKDQLTKIVYDATGRKLSIGTVKLKVSFSPALSLENVEFSNADWANNKNMISAESVDLGVALIPLLKKDVVVDMFAIKNAFINLEETSGGKNNWTFDSVKSITSKKQTSYKFEIIKSASASEGNSILSSLVIKKVMLDNVSINYLKKDGVLEKYNIKNLELSENKDENIDFNFNVNNGIFEGKGTFGALKYLESNMGFPFVAKLNALGISINTNMVLYNVLSDISFDGNVKVEKFLGANSFYNEKLDFNIKGGLSNIDIVLNSLSLAGNVVKGNIKADLLGKIPNVTATFNSDKIDIDSFKKKVAFSLIKEAHALENNDDIVIPYEYFDKAQVDARVDVKEIVNSDKLIAKNIMSNIILNNGKLYMNIVNAKVADGNVNFDASLDAKSGMLLLKSDANKINTLKLLQALGVNSDVFKILDGGITDVYVDLSSKGLTKKALIGDLNGRSVIIVDKSNVYLGNIGLMKGNIVSQLLNSLNITKGNDELALNCAVVRADVKKGVINFPNGLAFNADKFTLVANGDVNLNNEKVSIGFKPFAGKLTDTNIAKALSSLVKLTGTISNPSVGIDGANAIKAFVGVTTAGPVYLGAQMLVENDGSPCYTALKGTGFEKRFPEPKNVVQSTPESVGKALNGGVDLIKDTTKGLMNLLSGNAGKQNK